MDNAQVLVEGLGLGIPIYLNSDPRHRTIADEEYNAGAGGEISMWPGGGTGEGGRDAHYGFGKIAVNPGNNLKTNLIPFLEGAFNLNGRMGKASAVMPYYMISYNQDTSGQMWKTLTVIILFTIYFVKNMDSKRSYVRTGE